ncbi:hypothetical protein CRG98_005246 [Punica granatum]|uniref:Uncharacterized protein n=1 Tax=Punica granatum TaxID=22663 RepID=A0A2I0L2I0_PUNGR|nr:hypothetical protein CRG98_005246 [Punica granatum]
MREREKGADGHGGLDCGRYTPIEVGDDLYRLRRLQAAAIESPPIVIERTPNFEAFPDWTGLEMTKLTADPDWGGSGIKKRPNFRVLLIRASGDLIAAATFPIGVTGDDTVRHRPRLGCDGRDRGHRGRKNSSLG